MIFIFCGTSTDWTNIRVKIKTMHTPLMLRNFLKNYYIRVGLDLRLVYTREDSHDMIAYSRQIEWKIFDHHRLQYPILANWTGWNLGDLTDTRVKQNMCLRTSSRWRRIPLLGHSERNHAMTHTKFEFLASGPDSSNP